MKTREEQIAEMAKDLEQAKYWAMGTVGSLNKGFGGWYGVYMYNQGYRKQSDTVREFVEKLRDKEFSAKIGSEWVAVVKSLDIDEIVKDVCGE